MCFLLEEAARVLPVLRSMLLDRQGGGHTCIPARVLML